MGQLAKSFRRTCLVGAVAGALLGSLAPAALADSWWGAWKELGYYDGIDYESRSAVTYFDDGSGINARTRLDSTNVQMPAQHGYVHSRLFNGLGDILEYGWGVYSEWNTWSIFDITDKRYPLGHGTYVSRGWSEQLLPGHSAYSEPRWSYPVSIHYDP